MNFEQAKKRAEELRPLLQYYTKKYFCDILGSEMCATDCAPVNTPISQIFRCRQTAGGRL